MGGRARMVGLPHGARGDVGAAQVVVKFRTRANDDARSTAGNRPGCRRGSAEAQSA